MASLISPPSPISPLHMPVDACATSSHDENEGKNSRGPKIGGASLATDSQNSGKKCGGPDLRSDVKLATRHIDIGGKRTTIALERAFWREVDLHAERAGQSWQRWTEYALEGRAANIGKARWLRVLLLGR